MDPSKMGRLGYVPLGLAAGAIGVAEHAGWTGWAGSLILVALLVATGAALFQGGDIRDDQGAFEALTPGRIRVWGAATLGFGVALAAPARWAAALALEVFREGGLGGPAMLTLVALTAGLAAAATAWLGGWSLAEPEAMRAFHRRHDPGAPAPPVRRGRHARP